MAGLPADSGDSGPDRIHCFPHGFPSESSINRMLIVRRSSVIKDKGRGIDASASDSDRILMALGWPEKDYGLGTSKSLQIFVPETR